MNRLFIVVASLALLLDQATKVWARFASEGVEGRSLFVVWPRVFELKLVYNEGIAFGMFQGAGVFLTPIAALIAIGAAWYSFRHPQEPRSTHLTMALLCAGALGNMIDRVLFGKVTDMMWFRAIDFPVFNIADVCITIAGVMLAASVVIELFQRGDQDPPTADMTPVGLTDEALAEGLEWPDPTEPGRPLPEPIPEP